MPRKVLTKKSIFNVAFDNPFELSGKPVQDSRLPDFNINGSWKNSNSFNVNSIGFAMFGGSVTYDGGKRTANISKQTLEKSGATLLGMAPQVNKSGFVTQGFNYANPNFTNAVANNKAIAKARYNIESGGVSVDKRTQYANALARVEKIEKFQAGQRQVNLPLALQGSVVDDALNDPFYKTPTQQANFNASDSRIKQASKNKIITMRERMKTDPAILRANEIQVELGRSKIVPVVTRRRRGRWDTTLSEDPMDIINDYNKKTVALNWAKKTDPDFQIDPEKKVTVVDVESSSVEAVYWRHNGRSRRTGSRTIDTSTYKDILATELPKGDQMDMLYEKLEKASQEKKKKYQSFGVGSTKYYQPYDVTVKKELAEAEAKVPIAEAWLTKVRKGVQSKYSGRSQIGEVKYLENQQRLAEEQQKFEDVKQQRDQKVGELERTELSYFAITDDQFAQMQEHKDTSESNKSRYSTYYKTDDSVETYDYYGIADEDFERMGSYKKLLVSNIRNTNDANYTLRESLASSHKLDATTPLDDNSPKQKYLNYQKTGKDDYITPTVKNLKSQITVSQDSEKQNLLNSISFVEGKSKNLKISGSVVATRDNLGRITVLDKDTFSKYIKNTPSVYLKQSDSLDSNLIPELEKDNEEKLSKFSDIEKEYYRRERAKAQFAGTTRPKRSRQVRQRRRKR